jgi:hypothetical protein
MYTLYTFAVIAVIMLSSILLCGAEFTLSFSFSAATKKRPTIHTQSFGENNTFKHI